MTVKGERPRVGIIGFGRFGPVLARLLMPKHEVLAYDIVDITERARSAGAKPASWEEVAKAPTIFLAVPIRRLKKVVAALVPDVKPGTAVMDVCSVKVYPATVMKEYFPPAITTIASHPLFGPDSSYQGFQNLPLVMYPVSPRSQLFDDWVRYFRDQGLRVIEMSPEEHDRLAARSQGITHFIGRVLTEFGIAPTPIDTEGFRDLQLVVEQTCYDSFELFHDLENFNPYTMEMIDAVMKAVDQVKQSILRRE
ncbi:MAG: prephenate dehydrogenase/arogenate dehydrogenase family protein [Candidatus Neomarinimicrobiota bacterium]